MLMIIFLKNIQGEAFYTAAADLTSTPGSLPLAPIINSLQAKTSSREKSMQSLVFPSTFLLFFKKMKNENYIFSCVVAYNIFNIFFSLLKTQRRYRRKYSC